MNTAGCRRRHSRRGRGDSSRHDPGRASPASRAVDLGLAKGVASMFRRVWVLCLLVTVLLAACAQNAPGSGGAQGNAANGDKLFHQATLGKDNLPGCSSCHSTEPDKTLVGPSLAGIATDAAGAFKEE